MAKKTSVNRKNRHLLFATQPCPNTQETLTPTEGSTQRLAFNVNTQDEHIELVKLYDETLRNINTAQKILVSIAQCDAELDDVLNQITKSINELNELEKKLFRAERTHNRQIQHVAFSQLILFSTLILAQTLLLALNLPVAIGITALQVASAIAVPLALFAFMAAGCLTVFMFVRRDQKELRAQQHADTDDNESSVDAFFVERHLRQLLTDESELIETVDRDRISTGAYHPDKLKKYLETFNTSILDEITEYRSITIRGTLAHDLCEISSNIHELQRQEIQVIFELIHETDQIFKRMFLILSAVYICSAATFAIGFYFNAELVSGIVFSQVPFLILAYIVAYAVLAISSLIAYKYIHSTPYPTPTNNTQNIDAPDAETALENTNTNEIRLEAGSDDLDSYEDDDSGHGLSLSTP